MNIGTKSLLYGGHQFFIHPVFVACAWWKLYGFPWDPRLWILFFVHDWGYWGTPNMDGEEGENHVWLGARIISWMFDLDMPLNENWFNRTVGEVCAFIWGECPYASNWYCLSFYHSRVKASRYNVLISKLGIADKYSLVLIPSWLFLPMAWATGEWIEYAQLAKEGGKYAGQNKDGSEGMWAWHKSVKKYLREWVDLHKDSTQEKA